MRNSALLLPLLSCLVAASLVTGRTITIDGTLLNRTGLTDALPEGADFSLTLELDETTGDALTSPEFGRFRDAVGAFTLSVPSTGYQVSGEANAGHILYTYNTERRLNEPSVEVHFTFTDSQSGDAMGVTLEWLQLIDSPPTTDVITQDLTTDSFRLISAKLYRITPFGPGASYQEIYGFGWARAGDIAAGIEPVSPVRRGGYAQPVIFGDSLSASKQTGLTNSNEYFDGGYTNGPVWVQYLSWLLDINYVEKLNFSFFGGFQMSLPSELDGEEVGDSLGIYWSHSTFYSALFSILLAGEDDSFLNNLRTVAQEEFLRVAEVTYAMGIRDLLILSPADITIAPFVQSSISPTQQAALSQMIVDCKPDIAAYLATWFGGLFPEMRATLVDPNAYLDELIADPDGFGITTLTDVHLDVGPTPYSDSGSTFFFWDDIAPSTKVHATLAARIFEDVFAAVPLASQALRQRIIKVDDGDAWLFALNPSADQNFQLLSDDGTLQFDGPPLRTFTTSDPCLFFVVPALGDRAFYQLTVP